MPEDSNEWGHAPFRPDVPIQFSSPYDTFWRDLYDSVLTQVLMAAPPSRRSSATPMTLLGDPESQRMRLLGRTLLRYRRESTLAILRRCSGWSWS